MTAAFAGKVLEVPAQSAPLRLDHALVALGAARTRSQAKLLVAQGRVTIAGKEVKAGLLLRGGERIELRSPEILPDRPAPEDIPLAVLYCDEYVVALNKPSGLVVHPGPGARHGTLVNALLHHGLVAASDSPERPGIVHRLDKETSGVIVVARNAEAHETLARAFHDRTVRKTYVAIVLGTPRPASGIIDRAIGRHPQERQRMSVRSRRGRTARTRFEVVESFARLSLVRLEPETGRTHQIRVHLASIGHPVLGDAVYGSRRGRVEPANGPGRGFARHALHAAALELAHPHDGRPVRFAAPLADDMARLLEELRSA